MTVQQGWSIDPVADEITFIVAPDAAVVIHVDEYDPDGVGTDLWALGAWSIKNGYPAEVEFYSDRLGFAATPVKQQTIWLSNVADYDNFGTSRPIIDSDAITATLNARKLNPIRDLIPLDALLVMTSGGEWRATGGSDDVLAPATVGFKPTSYNGSSDVPALVIGDSAVFLERSGTVVRDMQGATDRTTGYRRVNEDLRVFASHLTDNKQIIDWCYQQYPFSIVWMVRNDGVLLAMTYMREQEILAWTPMEIDGRVESVCCVPENGTDVVYAVVLRTINGLERRYIEKLHERLITDVREGKFLDSCLTYDGRNTTENVLRASGATYLVGDTVTLETTLPLFDVTDIGDQIVLGVVQRLAINPKTGLQVDIGPVNCRLEILTVDDSQNATAQILTPFPVEFQASYLYDWAFARNVMSNLEHLEGREVRMLADGFTQTAKTVAGGQITLDSPGYLVHVGLAYTSDLETLDLNVTGQGTLRMKAKNIKRVGLVVQDTRSILVGADFATMTEIEPRASENLEQVPGLMSELQEAFINSTWDVNGRVCVRQADPLPMNILAVIPDFEVGQ